MFINQVGTQLVDGFRAGLEDAYTVSQLLCSYTLKHNYGVGVIRVEVQSPICHAEADGGAADVNLPTPALPKLSIPLTKGSHGRSKNACG